MKKTKKQKKIPIEKIEAMAAKGKDVSKYFSKGKMVSSLGKGSGQRTKKTPDKIHDLIAGWTQYWNDVLQPETPLDPNTVKALMASESSFNPKKLANRRNQNSARGLLQITNETRKILGDEKGELKDHFITVTREDLNNPSNNICAGIRWLFRKREIALSHWKRTATWDETVYEFKGARIVTKERAATLIKRFNEKLENLKKCEKS